MYPFASPRPYVRNGWYVAAFSEEVTRTPRQRVIMDEPIVLYRTMAGEAHAMWGLCAHRNFPLAEGQLVGDELQCTYHGYRFSATGACTRIPGQSAVPKAFRQRIYPCIERAGFVWLWMGDPSRPDPSRMPPLESVGGDQPGWVRVPNEVTAIPARWPLMIDNLMDLSHIGFLHARTIDAPATGEQPPQIETESAFRVTRRLTGADSSNMPYRMQAFPDREVDVDVEVGTEFFTPGFLVTYVRFFDAGTQRLLGTSYHYQGVTPQTRSSTHGFSSLVRDIRTDSRDFDVWLKASVSKTRAEDAVALAHIEQFADQYADARRELSGVNDVPGIKVRRHLSALLEAEGAAEERQI